MTSCARRSIPWCEDFSWSSRRFWSDVLWKRADAQISALFGGVSRWKRKIQL